MNISIEINEIKECKESMKSSIGSSNIYTKTEKPLHHSPRRKIQKEPPRIRVIEENGNKYHQEIIRKLVVQKNFKF